MNFPRSCSFQLCELILLLYLLNEKAIIALSDNKCAGMLLCIRMIYWTMVALKSNCFLLLIFINKFLFSLWSERWVSSIESFFFYHVFCHFLAIIYFLDLANLGWSFLQLMMVTLLVTSSCKLKLFNVLSSIVLVVALVVNEAVSLLCLINTLITMFYWEIISQLTIIYSD